MEEQEAQQWDGGPLPVSVVVTANAFLCHEEKGFGEVVV